MKNGIRQIIEKRIAWPPNLPKYLELAGGVDTDAAFDRCISQRQAVDEVERRTNGEVGYQCRTQLPADKARKLYKDTYMKWLSRFEAGELKEVAALPQFSSVDKMQNPEAVIRAGQIPAGQGFEAFKAMKNKLK